MSKFIDSGFPNLFPDYFDPESEREWILELDERTYHFTERTLSLYCVMLHVFLYNHDTCDIEYNFGCPIHSNKYIHLMHLMRPVLKEGEERYHYADRQMKECRKSGLLCNVRHLIQLTYEKMFKNGKNWPPHAESYGAMMCVKHMFGLNFPHKEHEYHWMIRDLMRDFHLWCGFNTKKVIPFMGDENCMKDDRFYQWLLIYVHARFEPLNPFAWEPLVKGGTTHNWGVKGEKRPLPELPNDVWKDIMTRITSFPPLVHFTSAPETEEEETPLVKCNSPLLFFEAIYDDPVGVLRRSFNRVKDLCRKENSHLNDEWNFNSLMDTYMDKALRKDLKGRVHPLLNLFKTFSLVCREWYRVVRYNFFFRPIAFAMSKSVFGERLVEYDCIRLCFNSCKEHFTPEEGHFYHVVPNWGSFSDWSVPTLKVMLTGSRRESDEENSVKMKLFGTVYTWWYHRKLDEELRKCNKELSYIEETESEVGERLGKNREIVIKELNFIEKMGTQLIMPGINVKELSERVKLGNKRKLSFTFEPEEGAWKKLKRRAAQ